MFSCTRTRGCATVPNTLSRSQKILRFHPLIKIVPNKPKSRGYEVRHDTAHMSIRKSSVVTRSSPSPLVPAAVGEVTVSNNGQTDFLSVSWRPAPGEVDSYLVSLSDRDRTLHTVSVSKSSPECVFNSLVSGRLYNISISSRSGQYQNHTFIQERTRECRTNTAKRQSHDPQNLPNTP